MPETRRVVCSECGKHSEIMDNPDHNPAEPIVWKCPKPLENGVDLCGATNSTGG